jgi:hypothetical protein
MPKQQFERAAALVHELYQGVPVSSRTVAGRLGINTYGGNATRALCRAAQDGLVQRIGRSEWKPMKLLEN